MHIAYLYVLNIFRLTYILLHLARAQMTCIHISHLKWLFFKKNKNAFYSIFPASRIFLLANWMASNVQLWRKQLNGIECTRAAVLKKTIACIRSSAVFSPFSFSISCNTCQLSCSSKLTGGLSNICFWKHPAIENQKKHPAIDN